MPGRWCYRFVKLRSCATLPDHHRHHHQHTKEAWRTRHMDLPCTKTSHCMIMGGDGATKCVILHRVRRFTRSLLAKKNTSPKHQPAPFVETAALLAYSEEIISAFLFFPPFCAFPLLIMAAAACILTTGKTTPGPSSVAIADCSNAPALTS